MKVYVGIRLDHVGALFANVVLSTEELAKDWVKRVNGAFGSTQDYDYEEIEVDDESD